MRGADVIDETKERWRAVVGYEGVYEVSNIGRVRSVARLDSRGHQQEGHLLSLPRHPRGYVQVRLYSAGVGETAKVHRMVLEAFTGPCPDGMEACHANGVRDDNRIGNLRWGTVQDNAADRVAHHPTCRRGHRLDGANLTFVGKEKRRRCRVCSRERWRSYDQGRPFDNAAADRDYIDIMGGAA